MESHKGNQKTKKKQISEEIKRKQKVSEEDQEEKYKDELTTINVLENNLYSNFNQKGQSNQLEPQSQTSEPCKEKLITKNITTKMSPQKCFLNKRAEMENNQILYLLKKRLKSRHISWNKIKNLVLLILTINQIFQKLQILIVMN